MKARVFRDPDQNRFTFSTLIVDEADENRRSDFDVLGEAMMLSFAMGTTMTLEKEWVEFDRDHFPHVACDLNGNMFVHGRATAYVFEGPLFESAKNADPLQEG